MTTEDLTVLIDNYDSFTWNVYQYLCELGAHVKVFRNDEISLTELIALQPSKLVISPGPGSPSTSSGISMEVIRYFGGKVPILGVCLGLQCMFELYGGVVDEVGYIVHGKTSELIHDGAGLYKGVPQRVKVTRYHSLAGSRETLPENLLVTSYTDSGVIQGVRHREYCLEGVQFHPESVISEHGKTMIGNFLAWTKGTWKEEGESIPNKSLVLPKLAINGEGFVTESPKDSILVKIAAKRREDVLLAQSLPGQSLKDLKEMVAMNFSAPPLDFYSRLTKDASNLSVLAELKRASPSKGDINMKINISGQAIKYASAGAAAISVLTEPKWFKGTLNDLRLTREVVARFTNRPAILRKDFIIDSYQVYESRLYGADTLLLIVAILSRDKLTELIQLSRSLGMEPLVEVNNSTEMELAIEVGAKVIGVNNRNLHNFEVDMGTTSRLAGQVTSEIFLIALSGINAPEDASIYSSTSVRGVLVGEALMRASDPSSFISSLTKRNVSFNEASSSSPKVKICGLTSVEAAVCAAQNGADFIGLIFAPSKRQVGIEKAREIIQSVRSISTTKPKEDSNQSPLTWFENQRLLGETGMTPKIVGVFRDQPASEINAIVTTLGLDYVQLHGTEPLEFPRQIPVPCIKVFHIGDKFDQHAQATVPNLHSIVLLDTQSTSPDTPNGGSGRSFDWNLATQFIDATRPTTLNPPTILAGGLTPENVKEAILRVHPYAVDVSSGVESNGEKDLVLIQAFIRACKDV